jgi:hypothetical protein
MESEKSDVRNFIDKDETEFYNSSSSVYIKKLFVKKNSFQFAP